MRPLAWDLLSRQLKKDSQGFPGGLVVKNLPANSGDAGSVFGPGRSQLSVCATTIEPVL